MQRENTTTRNAITLHEIRRYKVEAPTVVQIVGYMGANGWLYAWEHEWSTFYLYPNYKVHADDYNPSRIELRKRMYGQLCLEGERYNMLIGIAIQNIAIIEERSVLQVYDDIMRYDPDTVIQNDVPEQDSMRSLVEDLFIILMRSNRFDTNWHFESEESQTIARMMNLGFSEDEIDNLHHNAIEQSIHPKDRAWWFGDEDESEEEDDDKQND